MRYVAVTTKGKRLTKWDIVTPVGTKAHAFQRVTADYRIRTLYVDPTSPTNYSPKTFDPKALNIGIWDTQTSSWRIAPF